MTIRERLKPLRLPILVFGAGLLIYRVLVALVCVADEALTSPCWTVFHPNVFEFVIALTIVVVSLLPGVWPK